jgi:hypothetical protein
MDPTNREWIREFPVMVQYEYINHLPPPVWIPKQFRSLYPSLLQIYFNTWRHCCQGKLVQIGLIYHPMFGWSTRGRGTKAGVYWLRW